VKPLLMKIALSLGVLVLFLGVAEVVVRSMGEFDRSGNFYFRNRLIHPHEVPLKMVGENVTALQESDDSIVMYHEVLGWVPRPGSVSADSLYRYNSQGLRSEVEAYAARADSGVLRIALFGDSFTHGDDVPVGDSWGAVLESHLNRNGVPAEVLNFGVGGYGIDQALLRYTQQGKSFAPDLVILGFAPENLKRNLNLVRPLYDPRSGLPFAKPRFILREDGITLINVPVLPPEELAGTLRDFETWDLWRHEYFYDPADFRGAWWQHSKLLASAATLSSGDRDPWLTKRILFLDGGEEQQLGWMIISAFSQEVAASGAEFRIVHLPSHPEMELWQRLGRWTYQTFLDALDGQFDVVHPEADLLQAAEGDLQRVFQGHYNAVGNLVIADAVARGLRP
jgi:hypothetical protein